MSEGSLRSPSRSTRSSFVAPIACVHMPTDTWPMRSSVDVDKPCATRLGVAKHSTISYVRYSFLLRVVFFRYSTSKCRDLKSNQKVTQGYRKWTPFDSLYTSSCSLSIVTMMLTCVVHEILVENREIFIPATEFENLLGVHKLEWLGWDITSEHDGIDLL